MMLELPAVAVFRRRRSGNDRIYLQAMFHAVQRGQAHYDDAACVTRVVLCASDTAIHGRNFARAYNACARTASYGRRIRRVRSH